MTFFLYRRQVFSLSDRPPQARPLGQQLRKRLKSKNKRAQGKKTTNPGCRYPRLGLGDYLICCCVRLSDNGYPLLTCCPFNIPARKLPAAVKPSQQWVIALLHPDSQSWCGRVQPFRFTPRSEFPSLACLPVVRSIYQLGSYQQQLSRINSKS